MRGNDEGNGLAAVLRDARASFAAGLASRMQVIERLLSRRDEASVRELRAALHRLDGTAGTLGFVELGDRAKRLYQALFSDSPVAVAWQALREAVIDCERRVASASLAAPSVLLYGGELRRLRRWQRRLECEPGWPARVAHCPLRLDGELAASTVDVLVVDLGGADDFVAVAQLEALRRQTPESALLAVSGHAHWPARARLRRAGARRIASRNRVAARLPALIRECVASRLRSGWRVLLVEPDHPFGGPLTALLDDAGMDVARCSDPAALAARVGEVMPDLVVLGPSASDVEVESALRGCDTGRAQLPLLRLAEHHAALGRREIEPQMRADLLRSVRSHAHRGRQWLHRAAACCAQDRH